MQVTPSPTTHTHKINSGECVVERRELEQLKLTWIEPGPGSLEVCEFRCNTGPQSYSLQSGMMEGLLCGHRRLVFVQNLTSSRLPEPRLLWWASPCGCYEGGVAQGKGLVVLCVSPGWFTSFTSSLDSCSAWMWLKLIALRIPLKLSSPVCQQICSPSWWPELQAEQYLRTIGHILGSVSMMALITFRVPRQTHYEWASPCDFWWQTWSTVGSQAQ